ncbi:MAG: DUF6089 family protein [Bacteroidota bacterium]|jgi:hypothetical protein
MKKLFIIGFLFSLVYSKAGAQYRWEYGGGIGAANYLGEVGGGEGDRRDFIADLKLGFTRYQINGYSRYKISKDFSVKGNLIFVNISGNDNKSVNPTRVGRNLNFSTNIFEMSVQGEWNFYQQSRLSGRSGMMRGRKKKRTDFKSYLFAGVGFFYYNPKAEIEGKSYALRQYETEGVSYSPIGICYPIGIGFAYTINKTVRLCMDMSYRFTNTDYLDDASGTYGKKTPGSLEEKISNPNLLLPKNATAPSGKELPIAANYGWDYNNNVGLKRGDPSNKDGYFLVTATAGIVIKGKNKYYKGKYKSIANRRKVVKKKTRAKF